MEEKTKEQSIVEVAKTEINTQLANQETMKALLDTTFKGLDASSMKRAMLEGMLRGFAFEDFLKKNVYALPFNTRSGLSYSLVTSIDYARKIGMRSGVVGAGAPVYTEDVDGKILTCSVTIQKKVGNHIGEFTATAYFKEYYKAGYNDRPSLWDTKPHTMIAKVAEMHALRKACPEELAQSYAEEEMQADIIVKASVQDIAEDAEKRLRATTTLDELKEVFANLPVAVKQELEPVKDELKAKYEKAPKEEKVTAKK